MSKETLNTMPVTEFAFKEKYRYQNGFDSYFEQVQSPVTAEGFEALSSNPWANYELFV